MTFSVIYQPTNLFSLKESNSTNSGAKSLLLPSPYSIKMALFNQAITIDGEKQFNGGKSKELSYIRDAKIGYYISGSFCVNNCFVTIQSFRDGHFRGKPSFREYVYISDRIEIIFDVKDEEAKSYLQKYLHRINYFGKRGCFFQFVHYKDNPNESNVNVFDVKNYRPGILQEYDDMPNNAEFKQINNFDSAPIKRTKETLLIPVQCKNSSKSYTYFQVI